MYKISKSAIVSISLVILFSFSIITTFDRQVLTSWWKINYVVQNKQPIIANSDYVQLKENIENWQNEGRKVYIYCDYDIEPLTQIKFIYYLYPDILNMYYDNESINQIETKKNDIVVSCINSKYFSQNDYTQDPLYSFIVYTKK